MSQNHREFDLIIVGSGMVGAALACALGESGLKIAIIDNQTPAPIQEEGFDIRVSAITRASQFIFENIGAWQGMEGARVFPYQEMKVWDATGNGSIHFDAAQIAEPNLGYIIENRIIQAALVERLNCFDNITLLTPETPSYFSWDNQAAYLRLQSGTNLKAKLVVGADGRDSWLRQQAGISTSGWQYDQHALVATIRTEKPHQDTAWQRFLPDGPLAFLPLTAYCSSIVWSTTPEHAKQLQAMDDDIFLDTLHHSFGDNLGAMLESSQRGIFPLRLQHSNRYIANRLALVGDAAHAIHPLAGQGVNLGLADIAALCETLLTALDKKQNLGAHNVLRNFERRRKGDNIAMMASMDGFKRLFGSKQNSVAWLRNQGLNLADQAGPIKNRLMQHAIGVTGERSTLAKQRFG